jgi:hypothetical protein
MKLAPARSHVARVDITGLSGVLPQIQSLTEARRNLQEMRWSPDVFEISQTVPGRFPPAQILSTVSRESSAESAGQTPAPKPADQLTIDLIRNPHFGWSHYRILLGVECAKSCHFITKDRRS